MFTFKELELHFFLFKIYSNWLIDYQNSNSLFNSKRERAECVRLVRSLCVGVRTHSHRRCSKNLHPQEGARNRSGRAESECVAPSLSGDAEEVNWESLFFPDYTNSCPQLQIFKTHHWIPQYQAMGNKLKRCMLRFFFPFSRPPSHKFISSKCLSRWIMQKYVQPTRK